MYKPKMRPFDWFLLLVLIIVFFWFGHLVYGDPIDADYPDKVLTPGVTRTVDLKTLCTAGSTRDARHVTAAMKKAVFARYGFVEGHYKPGGYEVDHVISLELGGANDIKNLWPQKYCTLGQDVMKTGCRGAREKDVTETTLHRWVCANKITLDQAQKIIVDDWVKCFITIKQGGICHTTD